MLKAAIVRFGKAINRVITYPFRSIVALYLSPRNLLDVEHSQQVNCQELAICDSRYFVAEAQNARIFTNRVTNISFIQRGELVPHVSWQYEDGKVLPDSSNYVLSGNIPIDTLPHHCNCTVVSLLTGGGGNYNYYHWLFDCLPRLRIAEGKIKTHAKVKYLVPEDTQSFQQQTLDALGIPSNTRISSLDFRHVSASCLIATSHPNSDPSAIPEWIVDFLRDSFLGLSSSISSEDFIYISRGDSVNSRRLVNEDYLCEILISAGFGVYQLSELTVADQIRLFSRAKMIVGVHGAGLANLVFSSRRAVVYELFSEMYKPDMYERISKLVGLDYRKLICASTPSNGPSQRADIRIANDDIDVIVNHAKQIAIDDSYQVC